MKRKATAKAPAARPGAIAAPLLGDGAPSLLPGGILLQSTGAARQIAPKWVVIAVAAGCKDPRSRNQCNVPALRQSAAHDFAPTLLTRLRELGRRQARP
ncbi:hypothetical protein ABEG18_10645 [Alsobacter sp. KACC 23698]|uniref:Uncharacterized protein n=1 Tax=Alsobacter sp. KACC 23698 TaxID=3149229 RepID=A0AAU7JNZ3_9HYPH